MLCEAELKVANKDGIIEVMVTKLASTLICVCVG